MRRPSRRTIAAIAIPLLAVAVLVAGWAIDTRDTSGRTLPNVSVGGHSASHVDRARLAAIVGEVASTFGATPVEIDTADRTYQSTAAQVGLVVDQPATIRAALAVGHHDPWPERPLAWLASFAQDRPAPVRYAVQADRLDLELIALEGTPHLLPVEPSIVGSPDTVGVRGGTDGRSLDPSAVGRAMVKEAEQGRHPIVVSAEPVARSPRVGNAAAEALAAILTVETAAGLRVRAGKAVTTVPAATVRGWLGSRIVGRKLRPTIDRAHMVRDLSALLTGLGGKATDAEITLTHGVPTIVPSTEATACCAGNASAVVLAAIEANRPSVTVPLRVTRPAFTTADAQKLGIKQAVGTTTTWNGHPQVRAFTTYYPAGTAQATNIHRMADLVRGAIVKPGQTFSLDDRVGPRTVGQGFVAAPADDGDAVQAVGGGVSQFATTLFNAAFFAGLDLTSYQSHDVELPQYPVGREATIGYPQPDLRVHDNTPYGLLIWATYTGSSVTVAIYSTPWVYGQQTAQSSAPDGACTRVTTTRTRTYTDGHTTTDQVFGVYATAPKAGC